MTLEHVEEVSGNSRPTVILKSTGAIGDAVIASAVQHALHQTGYNVGLISAGFTLPLWHGLEGVDNSLLFDSKQDPPQFPQEKVVDISNYLAQFPHSVQFPKSSEMKDVWAHLCKWMGLIVENERNIPLDVSRDNVRVVLTPEEAEWGRNQIYDLSKANGNKPVVIISPNSGTKNRSLPSDTVDTVVKGLEGKAISYLLEPVPEMYSSVLAGRIGNKDLRKVAALLWAANAYIGADSGPLHIAAGSLQGTPEDLSYRLEVNHNLSKIVVALGSSNPDVIAYKGNIIVFAHGGCPVAPCGAHGYYPVEKYGEHFKRTFVPTAEPVKDKSGCIYNNYPNEQTALCMQSIPAGAIIANVRGALGK
ncbi:hypothetical protein HYV81_06545 [Candidatus Woesearchaeota archaeon]|nr:hypothetical protein [Candidatus Woesearchaeota archaeon]